MKTQIIDRTTGGSAETFKIGMKGYFWDNETSIHLGVLTGISKERAYPYERNSANNWVHFSPTIPEWFLPSEAKEKKGIELVAYVTHKGGTCSSQIAPSEHKSLERIEQNVSGFDFIKGTTASGATYWYLGHWNDGVL